MDYFDLPPPEMDEAYDYMVENFDKMVDGDIIPHLNLRVVYCTVKKYIEGIKEQHSMDIQKELSIWLKNEKEDGSLFMRKNWKTFRDNYDICFKYIAYNKLFQYKHYYFQLAIDESLGNPVSYCDCDEECKYCENDETVHFELALYGWKDDKFEKLQPDNEVVIQSNNIMPELDWSRKY